MAIRQAKRTPECMKPHDRGDWHLLWYITVRGEHEERSCMEPFEEVPYRSDGGFGKHLGTRRLTETPDRGRRRSNEHGSLLYRKGSQIVRAPAQANAHQGH
ncbi:hypothetical protein EYF80_038160 [Liparis tanakae]|uniref:Uncharacterized protein n=1 Tax=Liparis tanakae TaxID=230148 RepID=A0A4Z2GFY2_9TELE|nr:hypothetical protein EYF80_038160 [Liparis tanakae]